MFSLRIHYFKNRLEKTGILLYKIKSTLLKRIN